jgi:hypothetical protein
MNKLRAFFKNLFGNNQEEIICKRNNDGFYAYRKVQNQFELISGPYNTCEECMSATGAKDCKQ